MASESPLKRLLRNGKRMEGKSLKKVINAGKCLELSMIFADSNVKIPGWGQSDGGMWYRY